MRALRIPCLALRNGYRSHGATVVRALHRDDVLLASDHPGHLNGALDRLRSRIPEKERVKGFMRHQRNELVNELQVGIVEGDAALYGGTTQLSSGTRV